MSRRAGAAVTFLFTAGWLHAADDACLECHRDSSLTTNLDGREVSLSVDTAKIAGSIHAGFACTDCHENFDASSIPHHEPATQVNCLSCHGDPGKSHAFHPRTGTLTSPGDTPDVSCPGCHGTHEVSDRKPET